MIKTRSYMSKRGILGERLHLAEASGLGTKNVTNNAKKF